MSFSVIERFCAWARAAIAAAKHSVMASRRAVRGMEAPSGETDFYITRKQSAVSNQHSAREHFGWSRKGRGKGHFRPLSARVKWCPDNLSRGRTQVETCGIECQPCCEAEKTRASFAPRMTRHGATRERGGTS